MSVRERLEALDDHVLLEPMRRRWPRLFGETPQARVRLVIAFQVVLAITLVAISVTKNTTLAGAALVFAAGSIGLCIGLLRQLGSN